MMLLALLLAAETVVIDHLPPGEAQADRPLALVASVTNAQRLAAFEAHYRRKGEGWKTAGFRKDDKGRWVALVEAPEVRPPSLEYYLTAQLKDGPSVERFASESAPHPVLVRYSLDDEEHQGRLLRHEGHTSSATAWAEYVDFGSHPGLTDHYYQAESSYEYRLLDFVQHIRIGMGLIAGTVPPPGSFQAAWDGSGISRDAGLKYGFGELAFNFSDYVGTTGKLIFGADKLGFCTGMGGLLRIGEETGAHAEIGGQVLQRYGYDAYLRFAWDTVVRWPMGFAVHVTNMPQGTVLPDATPDNPHTDQGAPTGIRAVYDAGFRATDHLTLLAKLGYQARYSLGGGVTAGGGVQVEW